MIDTLTPTYIVGLDLGERRDYTALTILQRHVLPTGEAMYDVVELERWRGKGYSILPGKLSEVVNALYQAGHRAQRDAGRYRSMDPDIHILVDHTGVGIAVVEEIRKAVRCIGVTITGGDAVTGSGNDYRVPKRELVGRTQVLLEQRRLRIARDLDLTEVITRELENFRAKRSLLTGHDSYGAGEDWREGNHDDCVLAVAMACWFGEHCLGEDESDEVVGAMNAELSGW
jgi:hypothetical protein